MTSCEQAPIDLPNPPPERKLQDFAPTPSQPKGDQPRPSTRRASRSLAASLKSVRHTEANQYREPTEKSAKAYRGWLRHLGLSIQNHTLPRLPPNKGFAGSLLDAGRIWLIAETAGTNTGGGALALRAQSRAPIIIEAPHTFFDAKTLSLAVTLFETTEARALLINTLHRGGIGPDQQRIERVRRGRSASDAAHNPRSFFHQAHLELIHLWPRASVIQLHGFRDEKVPRAKIIVSSAGTTASIAPLARALNDALGPGTAALYPSEVSQLGGTTNTQAVASRAAGGAFIHLELAASLRTRLARQVSLRKRFAQALKKGLSVR